MAEVPTTVAELEEFTRARRWPVITPAYSRGADNVNVLAQDDDGRWRVGYRERGEDYWWPGTFSERDAVRFVLRSLVRFYESDELAGHDLSVAPFWSYFRVYVGSAEDGRPRSLGRSDARAERLNSQVLDRDGTWRDSDYLERYHLRGITEDAHVALSEDEARAVIDEELAQGRLASAPDEP